VAVRVFFHELVTTLGEIRLVQKAQLRTALDRIKSEPTCGKPLSGPLVGCRSVRVGGSENRLVYEVVSPLGAEPTIIHVLCIERRRDSEAYTLAAGRR
jgi:mRNA-degrading endonuclease RelE of RelBE toxin-antitoxin system